MMPRWAFGLWQCRERYKTAAESVAVLDGYRKRGIPVDVIVQDWQYWRPAEWGSHLFDPARFPDPARWVADLHDRHARVMISVWPKFYRGTANFKALEAAGALYQANLVEGKQDWLKNVFTNYDAFSPAARALYWAQIRDALFTKGVDAWWMDVSELEAVEGPFPTPAAQVEAYQTHMNPTALGSGARVLNAYPLVHAQGVYEGLRAAAPNQRVAHPDPQRLRGDAALRGGVVVGRHLVDLDGDAQAARRRARVRDLGDALLDVRHRRLLGARALRARAARVGRARRVARAGDALVRARRVRPDPARARPGAQARDVGVRRRRQPGVQGAAEVRSASLSPAAVRLLAGRGRDPGGRDDHAPAGDGLSGRRRRHRRRRPVHVRAGADGQPGDRVQGARAGRRVSGRARRLVRLLDRRGRVGVGGGGSPRRRSTPFRSTSAPARSSRSAPSCSTPTRSRPIRSRCSSTRAATAPSRSTRTTA